MKITIATSFNRVMADRTLDEVLKKLGLTKGHFNRIKKLNSGNPCVSVVSKKTKPSIWWIWEDVELGSSKIKSSPIKGFLGYKNKKHAN